MSLSIVIAVIDPRHLADELASQLTADGYEHHQAQNSRHAVSLIASRHADVLILGALERPAVALALLRELRDGALDPTPGPSCRRSRSRPWSPATANSTRSAPTKPEAITTYPPAPGTCTCAPSCMRSPAAHTA